MKGLTEALNDRIEERERFHFHFAHPFQPPVA
jgi:hypothetical protein